MVATDEKRAYKAEWERGKRRRETFEEREQRLAKRRETYVRQATAATRAEAAERSRGRRAGNRDLVNAMQRAHYAENREVRIRNSTVWNRINNFGVTPEDYAARLLSQSFKCAICSADAEENGRGLAVDHDHGTGHVRGLLCNKCNSGLGFFQDDRDLLLKAADYLLKDNLKNHG